MPSVPLRGVPEVFTYRVVYGALRGVQGVSKDVSVERLSVAEAAEALGVTRDAIHKRIKSRSVEYEKGEDGRFYVYVDTSTPGLDESVDKSKDESKVEVLERLIEGQQDRIEFLERELERRGDETTRLHQIVGGLIQANARLAARVPELEAPASPEVREPREDESRTHTAPPRPPKALTGPRGAGEAELVAEGVRWIATPAAVPSTRSLPARPGAPF